MVSLTANDLQESYAAELSDGDLSHCSSPHNLHKTIFVTLATDICVCNHLHIEAAALPRQVLQFTVASHDDRA